MEHVIYGFKKMKYFSLQMCSVSLLLSKPSKEPLQYDPQTIIRDTNIYAFFNIWKNNANASDIWNVYDKVAKLRLFLDSINQCIFVWFIVCQSRVAVSRGIFRLEKSLWQVKLVSKKYWTKSIENEQDENKYRCGKCWTEK